MARSIAPLAQEEQQLYGALTQFFKFSAASFRHQRPTAQSRVNSKKMLPWPAHEGSHRKGKVVLALEATAVGGRSKQS